MWDFLFKVDWHQLFFPSASIAELVMRGSIVYLMLFAILRFLPNRQVGGVGIGDLLVVILFANAAENAMASNYTAITDAFILVITIIFWSYSLNWLSHSFPRIHRFLSPPPLLLIKNGKLIHRNLRRELITESELTSQLRKQGVERADEVKMAFMESDGSISVIISDSQLQSLPRSTSEVK